MLHSVGSFIYSRTSAIWNGLTHYASFGASISSASATVSSDTASPCIIPKREIIHIEGRRNPEPEEIHFHEPKIVTESAGEERDKETAVVPESSPDLSRRPLSSSSSERTKITHAKITAVDLQIPENSKDHHTEKYEVCQDGFIDDVTKKVTAAQLVVRRGQEFSIKLTLNRLYDGNDQFKVIAKIGKNPLRSKGNYIEMNAGGSSDDDWSLTITQCASSSKEVTLSITSNSRCAVGRWTLELYTFNKGFLSSTTSLQAFAVSACILFNPWCTDDAVFMNDDTWKEEYVLNDTGKIYIGNHKQIFGRPWNFGQFESIALDCVLWLLDNKSQIPPTARGNPIVVCRRISALINSNDDGGILSGRWDGEYADGTSPTTWTGSVAILQQFMEEKRAVKYGQCWVFSGIVTTVFRALGIPTRPVTNFLSGHDTDGSLTIDVHWDKDGKNLPEYDSDSIWNYHVWNEVWMTRPDLKPGYGGWQVIDATPQEASEGIYCAGPASVEAVKHGDTSILYDVPFVFAEVNADRVHWIKQNDGLEKKFVETSYIGKCISTKAIGRSLDFSARNFNPDREDITHSYKYLEDSHRERAAVVRAATVSTKPQVYQDENSIQDVEFHVVDLDNVYIGSPFEVSIQVKNNSSSKRTVNLSVTLSSVYYTGVSRKELKHESFYRSLNPSSETTIKMKVKLKDYIKDLIDYNYSMKINYLASVKETNQIFASQDDFRLRTLIPEVVASKSSVKAGEMVTVTARFVNPLQTALTNCVFSFESAGNLKPAKVMLSDVAAGGLAKEEYSFTPKRPGACIVIVAFQSTEFGDIQGQCTVDVKE